MGYPFKNLVFEGGGVKGIAYVGVLEVLEDREIGILNNVQRVGGTSAGAIIALLVSLGYSSKELHQSLSEMDLKQFMDSVGGVVGDTFRLLTDGHGWFKGEKFMKWIEERIEQKGLDKNVTFKEIADNPKYKDIYIQGTNLSTYRVETFSAENPRYADMKIKDAVRISMSIPLFFSAVKMNGCFYVDGGLLSNYPVRLFDRDRYVGDEHSVETELYKEINSSLLQPESFNSGKYVYNKETLGFRLETGKNIEIFTGLALPIEHKIDSFFDFIWSLVATTMEQQANQQLIGDDEDRTVFIDTKDVSSIDFKLSRPRQEELIESGKEGCKAYLAEYKKAESVLRNKI
ncbi:patatin-like phospholipase family protein [Bacillus velezensis]|uniref:patatin-like phospholipase family protein n=1 Tax=Bacillus velezensis TaxID=492670 RepID=UPI002243877B|nr:patatin-like phospholipase family protein [Bacillus velezensis]MCW8785879.1 patatin-like phospholipase family protein [Bacillus velezensis]